MVQKILKNYFIDKKSIVSPHINVSKHIIVSFNLLTYVLIFLREYDNSKGF